LEISAKLGVENGSASALLERLPHIDARTGRQHFAVVDEHNSDQVRQGWIVNRPDAGFKTALRPYVAQGLECLFQDVTGRSRYL